ncbi:phosphoribosyl-AMP cyclohydrolase [Acuticoccus kandeliae]|uniref:phosphoribosyl-AMP cyclohydrolase n=1 Tax=Acuticoccus kandeliae TaxID=2073160 RepID=UPI000D3E23DE|nr:phosphoribosyl-AMP cyclohydrolase [Acuticoccus kandeliae]
MRDFPAPSPDKAVQELGDTLSPKFGPDGLVTALAVDAASGEVLMLAHMDRAALAATIETGIAHYYSRSRKSLWKKGETSGQIQTVVEMRVDCDQDAILLRVSVGGDGGACHTGARSCFYRAVGPDGALTRVG